MLLIPSIIDTLELEEYSRGHDFLHNEDKFITHEKMVNVTIKRRTGMMPRKKRQRRTGEGTFEGCLEAEFGVESPRAWG